MENNCTICNIVNKSLKSHILYEDALFIAFLDIKPLFIGHALLAPKNHYETIYDLPELQGNALLKITQQLGQAINASLDAQGSFIAINNNVSQSIPHLHIHLVPRNKGDGLKGFFWPRKKYQNEEEMREVQLKIQDAMNR